VSSELSYDKFHKNADRIFRINQTFIWGDDTRQQFSSTGPGVAMALQEELPEAQLITRVHTPGNYLVTSKTGDEVISFEESRVLAADSNFLQVFTYPLVLGDAETALKNPQSVVLTQEAANRYFPNADDPTGKIIKLGQGGESASYQVTGVFQPIPENTYIKFDLLLSMSSFPRVRRQGWTWIWTTFETYVLLNKNADIGNVKHKLITIPSRHAEATLQRIMGTTFEDYVKSGKEWKLYLQPFTDIHLGSANVLNRLSSTGNSKVVTVLTVAGILILLLSCINYMNLKTSQATRYAKDTGIRKLMGSSRIRLSFQYIIESFHFIFISVIIGLLMAYISLPYFAVVAGIQMRPTDLLQPSLLMDMGGLILILSVMSGIYPAVLLSSFKPVDVLRGKIKSGRAAVLLRTIFVVFQFAISIGLIASSVIVYQQLQYTFDKDVGFQKENVLIVNQVEWIDHPKSFRDEISNISGIINVSLGTSVPPKIYNADQFLPEEDQNKNVPLNYTQVDEKYLPTLGLQLLYGKNFSDLPQQEKYHVIINEAAVKAFGWHVDKNVLEKRIVYPGSKEPFTIIGVVKDFSYWNVQAVIEPLAIFHIDNPIMGFYGKYAIAVKFKSADLPNIIGQVKSRWKSRSPGLPFKYEFVDDAFAASFSSSVQFRKSLTVFASLALLIAGLGLLGMIIYAVEQRTKEIGIRKVLGSSTLQIIILMTRRVLLQVTLSLILSIPLTYWAMSQWLLDFEYHISISMMVFLFAGWIAGVLAFGIVGFQAYRAANMSPTITLRDE